MLPLLDRGPRARRRDVLEACDLDPAADFLVDTSFEPGLHTVSVPLLPADVRRHLISVEHMLDPATGRVTRRRVPLVLDRGGRVLVPCGLVPLLAQAARRRSGAVPAEGATTTPTPFVAPPAAGPDPLVVAHLLAHRRMVVRHGRGVDAAGLIAGLTAALPDRRVAVIAPRRQDVGHLAAGLAALGVDARGVYTAADYAATPPRVAVGTPAGSTSTAAWHTGCSVVVALDGVHFCGQAGVSCRLEEAWVSAHWVGLTPADRSLSPLERDRLVCMFGPHQLHLPAHGQVRRQVVFAAQSITLPAGGGFDRVVTALAGELAGRGPGTGSPRFGVVGRAAGFAGPVVVLADDEQHRRRLERLLPAGDRGRVRVVTPDGLADVSELGVLVRADHRPHLPAMPQHLLVEPQVDRHPLLVVDAVADGAGELARRRGTAYRAAGWASLEAHRGGWVEWERWVHRRLPDDPRPEVLQPARR